MSTMHSLYNASECTASTPPGWLHPVLRKFYVPEAPADSLPVAGCYVQSEKWMLENQAADMMRGRSAWVIAPMFNGLGTYRMSKPTDPAK